MASQEIFQDCYRGRQTALHHMSYMRMAKVLLTLDLLQKAGIPLEGKAVFDYGFGAGTFFRYCPTNTRLSGVEIDPQNVEAVKAMLAKRGYRDLRLEIIEIDAWEQHPLLQQKHDVVLCSHVLEHLPDPASFLRRIRECLADRGSLVGLVPLNERRPNPHHVQTVDAATIRHWAEQAGLKVTCYIEADPWTYWVQPLYTFDSSLSHKLAQAISLLLGLPATALGHRLWRLIGRAFAALTFSRPTQAAFVLERNDPSQTTPPSILDLERRHAHAVKH
jgi:2-polyprenyl-3-methyl-5-hydroxy-6-metoxy-1,4-benzoquinol methylase